MAAPSRPCSPACGVQLAPKRYTSSQERATRQQPPHLPDIFDEHGIAAKLHVLPITGQQAFGETLLRTAHQLDADMLVMGAFARHPVRSLILGGVTRHMLAHADLPVLMRH